MQALTKQIPNLITLSNLLGGCIAVVIILTGTLPLEYAFLCTIFSLVADFLDGLTARWLKVQSPLGLQLDSLADMVSFGLVPALIIFKCFILFNPAINLLSYFAFLITLGSAYRLAKFNIDTEQSTYFKGLATPANTILCIGIYFILKNGLFPVCCSTPFLIVFSCISTLLLVSNLPLFSFKIKKFSLKKLLPIIILLLSAIILFIIFKENAIAFIIIIYIILSILFRKTFIK